MGRIVRDADGNVVDIIEGSAEPEETPWGKPLKNWEDAEDEADEEEAEGRANVTAAREESEVVKGMYLQCGSALSSSHSNPLPHLPLPSQHCKPCQTRARCSATSLSLRRTGFCLL